MGSSTTPTVDGQTNKFLKIGAAVVLGIAVALLALRMTRSPDSAEASDGGYLADYVWYSVDDGKNWFADKKNAFNEVQRDGKTATRCYLYTCDDGKTRFVAYMERFTPEASKTLKEIVASKSQADASKLESIMLSGVQVKKPGGSWMPNSDSRALALTDPTCPNDPTKRAQMVLPTPQDLKN